MKKPKILRHKISRRQWLIGGPIVVAVLLLGGSAARAALNLGSSSPEASSSTSVNLQKGLLANYLFNGNTKDSTPHAFNGVDNGATLTTDREGRANSAYSFNGSSYIEVNPWAQLTGSVPRTVSAWFETSTAYSGTVNHIIVDWGSGTANAGMYFRFYNSTFGFDIDACSTTVSETPYINGSWHLAVGTYNTSGTLALYMDGKLVSSTTSCTPNTSSSDLAIGGGDISIGHGSYFTGSIGNVRIYNRTLDASEVTALYSNYNESLHLDNSTGNLLGWWKMQGNTKDSSPYADNGTDHGATLTTDRENAANNAYSFNGSSYISLPNSSTLAFGAVAAKQTSISLWYKATNSDTNPRFLINRSTDGFSDSADYALFTQGGTLTWGTGPASDTCAWLTVTEPSRNVWHYLVATITQTSTTSGTKTLYIDNTLVGSCSYTHRSTTSSAPIIGAANSNSPTSFWEGSISDLRLYNMALTAAQISTLYHSYNSEIELGGSGASTSVNLNKGLVGYWPFNGNAKDATPYSDNGTVSGATLTTDREGRANSAYSFNGTSNLITVPNSTALSPTGNMSISVWLNVSSSSATYMPIVSKNSGGATLNPDYELAVDARTGNGYALAWRSYNTSSASTPLTTSLTNVFNGYTGVWVNIVASLNGTTLTVYRNGQNVGTITGISSREATTAAVTIGERLYGGTYSYYVGSMNDLRIYNRALTAAEAAALYNLYE